MTCHDARSFARSWGCKRRRSDVSAESPAQSDTHGPRLCRVRVDAGDRVCFARQSRRVVVVDVADLAIGEVEHVDHQLELLARPPAEPCVEQGRGTRAHAVVFDQRARPDVAQTQAAEPRAVVVEGQAERCSRARWRRGCSCRPGRCRGSARATGRGRNRRSRPVAASSSWRTRCPGGGSGGSPRWCRRRRRTPARSRGRGATARSRSAVRAAANCASRARRHASAPAAARARQVRRSPASADRGSR